MTDPTIRAEDLGLRYRRRGGAWALRGCDFTLPAGRVCALVGPNGAGKSTLLALAAGLLRPTEGTIHAPAREHLAYVAQDKPLHPRLSVADTLRMGRELNPGRWDEAAARRVIADELDPDALVRDLSGGGRTRVALALALGKRPELLLLDEPMADLDPLARHQLMGLLMADAAERGTTVVMSSHILTELEGSCDHLLLLHGGKVRLDGPVDTLLSAHTLLTGPIGDLAPHTVVESRTTGRQLTALVRHEGPVEGPWDTTAPSLEDLLLAHLRATEGAPA
ncbi:ABC transporter ATP-binding protein [Streptomyces venezuelae]|uniref:ABC transporter ATP-binding protein n=1 Tax=Streptomyces venezuelae TaxID=54571 RepID=UPI00278BF6E9|nr:ABC transporter ATP-binding protein [Streptomyces venezuelae]